MRMRKKKNLEPRLERCEDANDTEPRRAARAVAYAETGRP